MKSRLESAFKEQANMIGLSAFVACSIAMLNPIPLFVGLALEAAYLLFFADSELYSKIIEQRNKKSKKENFLELEHKVYCHANKEFINRYEKLSSVRIELNADYESNPDWRDVIDKLDILLEKYLQFGLQEIHLTKFISSLSNQAEEELGNIRGRLSKIHNTKAPIDKTAQWVETNMENIRLYFQSQIQSTQHLLDEENIRILNNNGNLNNRYTLEKRIEIQSMSLNQAEKIGQGLINLKQQMALMEETIQLINGQIKSKQPNQVLLDIQNIVDQSEIVSNFLYDMVPYDEDNQIKTRN